VGERRQQGERGPPCPTRTPAAATGHPQTFRGFTSIRPRISMWSAWQNHWQ
jgi:hypothetical protein